MVYRATSSLNEGVAIKKIDSNNKKFAFKYLIREMEALSLLRHKYLPHFIEYFENKVPSNLSISEYEGLPLFLFRICGWN